MLVTFVRYLLSAIEIFVFNHAAGEIKETLQVPSNMHAYERRTV